MNTAIDVKDRAEGERLKLALQDETVRACVTVMVALLPLTTRARNRVLAFVVGPASRRRRQAAPGRGVCPEGSRAFVI